MRIDFFRLFLLLTSIVLSVQLLQFWKKPDRFVMERTILWIYCGCCAVLFSWAVLAPVFLSSPWLWAPAGAALLFCLSLLILALFTAVFPYLARKNSLDGTESALLVLGAPVWDSQPTTLLASRALAAALWKQLHPNCPVVLSGGKKDTCTEASLMADIMNGLLHDDREILLEENSLTTDDNFLFSKAILLKQGWTAERPLAVATNNFHFFRLRYYARRCGYGTLRFLIVPTPKETAMVWYFREAIVLVRYWLLKK